MNRLLGAIALAIVFAVTGGTLSSVQAQTPRQIAESAFRSIVLLSVEDLHGKVTSIGTGFFVDEDLIATNFHVVAGASRVRVKIVGTRASYEVSGAVGLDEDADLCVLKVAGVRAQGLRLGDDRQKGVGDTVYAAGNPRGLEGTFSQGIISAFRGAGPERLIQITAPISPGSSGGPVLDASGYVIGVAVATVRDGQNLNFAVPASTLKRLLGRLGPIVAFPPPQRRSPPAPDSPPHPSAPATPVLVFYVMAPRDPSSPGSVGTWKRIGEPEDTPAACEREAYLTRQDGEKIYPAAMRFVFGDNFDPKLVDSVRRVLARSPKHPMVEEWRKNAVKWAVLETALRADEMRFAECVASDDPRLHRH